MTKERIIQLLELLNEKLKSDNVDGEIYIFGGAVMCLVMNTRAATYDIDTLFSPKLEIYKYAKEIAAEEGLPENWLNDGVKDFVSQKAETKIYAEHSNLIIFAGTPEYIFAMKAKSARTDNANEVQDLKELIAHLNIQSFSDAESIISKYYPADQILPKTRFLIEELLDKKE